MADNVNSRSRRRRSRANRKTAAGAKKSSVNRTAVDASESADQEQTDASGASAPTPMEVGTIPEAVSPEVQQNYRVESPELREPAAAVRTSKSRSPIAKSKSLDDLDDQVKITELSEGEEKTLCHLESGVAIVAEVDSDVEWEIADELIIHEEPLHQKGTMSTLTLALGENITSDQVPLISPEDELSLRNFLEGLNLVNSPEDAIKVTHEKASAESIKAKRAQKRAALEQHFLPMYKHPRYLDVINEENSDQSDKEQNQNRNKRYDEARASTSKITEDDDWDDDDDDVFTDDSKICQKMQSTIVSCVTQIRSEPVHVIDNNVIQDASWSTSVAECCSGAEVVYLDDSSNSRTPSEMADADVSQDADEDEEEEKDTKESAPENAEIHLEITVNNNTSQQTESEQIKSLPLSQLTPPPTPDSISPKNEKISTETKVFSTSVDSKRENVEEEKQTTLENSDPIDCADANENACKENQWELSKCIIEIRDVEVKDNLELTSANGSSSVCNDRMDPSGSPVTSTAESMCSDCSSRSTSQSTVRQNIISSSPVADIMSLLHDEEQALRNMLASQPLMLKEICLQKLLSLPFGAAMLEELAEVSSLIDVMTSSASNSSHHSTTTPSKYSSIMVKDDEHPLNTNISFILPESSNPSDEMTSISSGGTKWVGLPTDEDPSVLLCLSPSQRNYIESGRSVPDEAGKLLDLHRKFIDRRGYHEQTQIPPTSAHTARKSAMGKVENTGNRLLAIIRDTSRPDGEVRASRSSAQGEMPLAAENSTQHREIIHQITLEDPKARERYDAQMSNRNISATLPRVKRDEDSFRSKYDRLRARDLSEWLQLARGYHAQEQTQNASMKRSEARPHSDIPQVSTNNLQHDAFKGCDNKMHSNPALRCRSQPRCPKITADDASSTTTTTTTSTTRRLSLPHQVHERQMQYILQKEREIELEIQNLEAEKKRLSHEMGDNLDAGRNFEPNQYHISRQGDIAIRSDITGLNKTEKIRPRSMPLAPSEFFRQKMYDEYMRKVAAREERKYHKVIKISSRPTSLVSEETVENSSYTIQHAKGIENEFMDRVKERMGKLGINTEDFSDKRQTEQSETEEDIEQVLIFDGETVHGRRRLPKHLQEFIDITRIAADDGEEQIEDDGEWKIAVGFGLLSLLLCAYWWNNNGVIKLLTYIRK